VAAILIGPAPGSELMGTVYPYFRPYLRALALDTRWAFFAPNPTRGRTLRYTVEDAQGARHEFRPTESLARWEPGYFRLTTLYAALRPDAPALVASAGRYLCRRHAALAPRSVTFVLRDGRVVTPEEYLAGARPLDDGHVEERLLPEVACGPAASAG